MLKAMTLFVLFSVNAFAGVVNDIRVFVGDNHAQVLIVADSELELPSVRSTAPVGASPARSTAKLTDVELSGELEGAYGREDGRWILQVDEGGISRLTIATLGNDLMFSAEMLEEREISATVLADRAILLDYVVAGSERDGTLATASQLERWVRGGTVEIRGDREVREHYVVVLDPGHGGWDPGAVGISGTREADIALSLSRRIAVELERLLDVEVILTRDDNTFIPLVERANIANSLNADLFVSVHANASDRESAWGIETYYLDGASDAGAARVAARENALAEEGDDPTSIVSDLNVTGTNRLSQSLAVTIQTEVVRAITETFGPTHTRDLGVKSALFAVLVWSRMPSVLFESSFVTNRVDETRLRLPYYQQTQAEAIATAIQSWFDSVER